MLTIRLLVTTVLESIITKLADRHHPTWPMKYTFTIMVSLCITHNATVAMYINSIAIAFQLAHNATYC